MYLPWRRKKKKIVSTFSFLSSLMLKIGRGKKKVDFHLSLLSRRERRDRGGGDTTLSFLLPYYYVEGGEEGKKEKKEGRNTARSDSLIPNNDSLAGGKRGKKKRKRGKRGGLEQRNDFPSAPREGGEMSSLKGGFLETGRTRRVLNLEGEREGRLGFPLMAAAVTGRSASLEGGIFSHRGGGGIRGKKEREAQETEGEKTHSYSLKKGDRCPDEKKREEGGIIPCTGGRPSMYQI